MKTKLLFISIIFVLLLSISSCGAVKKAVKTPKIDLYVSIDGLSSSGLSMDIETRVTNPNSVTLDIGDLQVIAKGETGEVYIQDTIMGGSISPNSSHTFRSDITIPIQVVNERNIMVTADSGARVAGITLPIKATITIEVPKLASLISIPQPDISISTPRLRLPPAPPSVELPVKATITNDNNIGLILGDLHIKVNANGQLVKTETIPGATVPAHGTHTFEHSIILGLELLKVIGSSSVTVEVDTEVGISGISERIPIRGQFTLELPPLPPLP